MPTRTGIAALTQAVKHICRILTSFRPAVNGVIQAAVTAGTITPAQSAVVNSWLDAAQGACDILRAVSGY